MRHTEVSEGLRFNVFVPEEVVNLQLLEQRQYLLNFYVLVLAGIEPEPAQERLIPYH